MRGFFSPGRISQIYFSFMPNSVKWFLIVFFAAILLAIACSKYQRDNPVDTDYQGNNNYKLSIIQDSLPDTLEVFHRYAVPYITDPKYPFTAIKIDSGQINLIDTAALSQSRSSDSLLLYFTAVFNGALKIIGVQPNNNAKVDSIIALVINPYHIMVDTLAGCLDTVRASVAYSGGKLGSVLDTTRVIWLLDDIIADTTKTGGQAFNFLSGTIAGTRVIGAMLQDKRGNKLTLGSARIHVSGYKPRVDSIIFNKNALNLGDSLTFNIFVFDQDNNSFRVFVEYGSVKDSSGFIPYQPQTHIVFAPVRTRGEVTFSIYTMDSTGLKSAVVQKTITIAYATPTVKFAEDSLTINAKEPTLIPITKTSNVNKVVWRVDTLSGLNRINSSKPDTNVLDGKMLTFTDTLQTYRLIASAIDSFGYSGPADSIRIRVHAFGYSLASSLFPLEAPAKRRIKFAVSVDSLTRFIRNKGVYSWKINDTLQKDIADTLVLFYNDSVSGISVKVQAKDSAGNSSAEKTGLLTVKQFTPLLRFKNGPVVHGKINEAVNLAVYDSITTADDTIANVYWQLGANTNVAGSAADTIKPYTFTSPESLYVKAWAVNTRGFASIKDSALLLVRAYRPYFYPLPKDTATFINNPMAITLHSIVSDTSNKNRIARYFWDFNNDKSFEDSSSDSLDTHSFLTAGSYPVQVYSRDTKGNLSDTAKFLVTVSNGEPVIKSFTHDTAWVFNTCTFKVSAQTVNPSSILSQFYIAWDLDSAFVSCDTSGAYKHFYTTPGLHKARTYAVDNFGLQSLVDTVSVNVTLSKPAVTSFAPNTAWIFDSATFTATAQKGYPDGSLSKFYIAWDLDSAFIAFNYNASLAHKYLSSGTHKPRVYVVDTFGLQSVVDTFAVNVNPGKPVVSGFAPDSAWVFDPVSYTVTAQKTNPTSTLAKVFIAWDAAAAFTDSGASLSYSHSYNAKGLHNIKVYAQDSYGTHSDTMPYSVNVKQGVQTITAISTDTAINKIYVFDPITFTVAGATTHGTLDSIKVAWKGDTNWNATSKAVSGGAAFQHSFALSDSGLDSVRFRVKDSYGFTKDSAFKFTVLVGHPAVSNLSMDTTGNNLFVNDLRTYSVHATDPNGYVKYVFASWNDGAGYDSLIVNRNAGAIDTFFRHSYDTGSSGSTNIHFWAKDENGILSARKDSSVTVRKAAPVLWGDAGDTLWTIINNGYANYYYRPDHFDTNGVIQTYYFGLTNDTGAAIYKGPLDSASITIDNNNVNKGSIRYIFGKDDDGFLRGNKSGNVFVVFADSAPVVPSLGSVTISGDSVKFVWQNSDFKDGDSTQFQILFDTNNPPTTIIKNFGTCRKTGANFYYWYHPTAAGTYRYKVISKDARGTTSTSSVSSFFDYP
ncbi:MAG: hypothetical protein PHC61_00365 [Chitinivibrionales bacterium]|nr:hypothetical protein [Chitinivibrionales bacterium]